MPVFQNPTARFNPKNQKPLSNEVALADSSSAGGIQAKSRATDTIQRKCQNCAEEEAQEQSDNDELIQAKPASEWQMQAKPTPAISQTMSPMIQREEFEPWPGQIGHDVANTREQDGGIIRERVQRTGDPVYSSPQPSLLEFDPGNCRLTATMDINFVRDTSGSDAITEEQFNTFKAEVIDIGNERLNGWINLSMTDSDACNLPCAGQDISVNIVAQEGSGPYSSEVLVSSTVGRENARHIGIDTDEGTIWHELGHIVLGAADEYPDIRHDNTPRPAERVNTDDYSIMSQDISARRALMHPRHFSHLAAWMERRFPNCGVELSRATQPLLIEYTPIITLGGFGTFDGRGGIYYTAGVDLGIPLDELHRFQLIMGPRINWSLETEDSIMSLLLGWRMGVSYLAGPSGVSGSIFAEGGGLGWPDLSDSSPGVAPYVEGGFTAGYTFAPNIEVAAEAAMGTRDMPDMDLDNLDMQPYFRMGLQAAFAF